MRTEIIRVTFGSVKILTEDCSIPTIEILAELSDGSHVEFKLCPWRGYCFELMNGGDSQQILSNSVTVGLRNVINKEMSNEIAYTILKSMAISALMKGLRNYYKLVTHHLTPDKEYGFDIHTFTDVSFNNNEFDKFIIASKEWILQ